MFATRGVTTGTLISKRWRGLSFIEILIAIAILGGTLIVLGLLLMPATRSAREPARRSQCKNNLKQLVLALHNYADRYGALPPAFTVDADGRPLHSWRTLILPFMDHEKLFQKIDLTKPWDDPANAEAFKSAVPEYLCPSAIYPSGRNNVTAYLAVVTPNSALQATEPRLLKEITDGLSSTLLLIEVDSAHAVPWMSPQDADESLIDSLGPGSQHSHTGGTHVGCADGTVRFINDNISKETLRALISASGNEPLDNNW